MLFRAGINSALDGDPAVVFDGVKGIEQQVNKHLLDLVFIQQRFDHVLGHVFFNGNMPQVKLVLHNTHGGCHNFVDVGRNLLGLFIAGEFEQPLNDGFTALGFPDNNFQAFFEEAARFDLFCHVGAEKQDAAQGVVDFVGNAGGHAAQGRHFFHLGGQVGEVSLLVFRQPDPLNDTGALLGDGDNEIQFVFGKGARLGQVDANQPQHFFFDGQRYVEHHADAFIPRLLRVFNPGGVPDVRNDQ